MWYTSMSVVEMHSNQARQLVPRQTPAELMTTLLRAAALPRARVCRQDAAEGMKEVWDI